MDRYEFRKIFKIAGPVVLPAIPVLTTEQTERNVLVALREQVPGVLLTICDFPYDQFLPIITAIRSKFPALWFGVNFHGTAGTAAFPVLEKLHEQGVDVDAYWTDSGFQQKSSLEMMEARQKSSWRGMYFGGAAPKMQATAVGLGNAAAALMDVVTTSTHITAKAPPIDKVKEMRKGCGKSALALVSDTAVVEAADYTDHVDCFIVTAGIFKPGDLHSLDPLRLRALMHAVQQSNKITPIANKKWYLNLIAPNTRGPNYAWCDPSSIYIDGQAFRELTEDLLIPFNSREVDLVAGIDGMGFPLASAIATRLGKGLIIIRKAGRLPVDTDEQEYVNYLKKKLQLEMRKNAFLEKTRVLLVDQWIETGGTMEAAISLIKRQAGVVAGIAAICMERRSPITAEFREAYKCSFAVPESLQAKFDGHSFLEGTIN